MRIRKFTGMSIAAKMPKARIGRMSERAFAAKATAVVDEVTRMARKERLKAKDKRLSSSLAIAG